MRIQPMARRSTWREGTAGRELAIPVRRNWVVLVVVPVWLTLWISGIAGAAGQVISGRARGGEAGFFEVWLVAAVLGGGVVVYTWLWNAIGREVVGLRPGVLVVRRDVSGLGFSREYGLADVRNLRVSVPPSDAGRWCSPIRFGREPGVIAFDHGARTVRFGEGLDEAEASLVLEELGLRGGIQRPAA
jgi:hypothetical protein